MLTAFGTKHVELKAPEGERGHNKQRPLILNKLFICRFDSWPKLLVAAYLYLCVSSLSERRETISATE